MKCIQSRYATKSSTFCNDNNCENKSEQSKDGTSTFAAAQDSSAFDKTTSDDGNVITYA